MAKYVTQRGVETDERPYRDLDQDEREQILADNMRLGSVETKNKWNISSSTLGHIRYHNKEAEQEIEDKHFKELGF